jgi:hypothetical protein
LGTVWGAHLGTVWELGNTLQTLWEHIKNKGKTFPCPTLFQQEQNWIIHECMLSLPDGCVKFLFPKLFMPIFPLVLMAGAEIWGHTNFPISPIPGRDHNLNSSGSMGKNLKIKKFTVALPKTLPTTTEVLQKLRTASTFASH